MYAETEDISSEPVCSFPVRENYLRFYSRQPCGCAQKEHPESSFHVRYPVRIQRKSSLRLGLFPVERIPIRKIRPATIIAP